MQTSKSRRTLLAWVIAVLPALAQTGAKNGEWRSYTIPRPGEFGYNTGESDSTDYTGVWGQINIDEQLGLAYLPVQLPTGDYYGGHRPGNGLSGESIVTGDLKAGVRKGHYQLVHHGIWDFDIPCAPILVDITVNSRPVKAVAQPTKQAFLYMFDHTNGQLIFPLEERPIEQSTVPGEKISATQPFPSKPPAYDRQGFSLDDLIDFTPELKAQAREIVSRYKIGPVFTPPSLSKAEGPIGTLAFATASDRTNWAGGSVDPETGITFVPWQKALTNLAMVPSDPKTHDFRFIQGTATEGARGGVGAGSDGAPGTHNQARLSVQDLPLFKPPYGQISAIDLDQGEIIWQIPHGETPDVIRGEAGTITLPNGKKGAYLRAYDKKTEQDAGVIAMPVGQTGSPITYMLNGKHYSVVVVGAAGYPAEYRAYRLPN